MSKITFRRMTENDLEKVSEIERDIFSDPWSYNAFKTDLNNDMAFPLVAEFENLVIGYTNLYIVAGEVQIGNFAVAQGYRKRGVGKKLMDQILSIANERKCDSIFLEVRDSNEPAKALYGSFGFQQVGLRRDYYTNPRESAVIMAREV
ncbi:MAG: ribosomal protein S18-alanine N-acetyltransferase [candidate division Zixibacteria bacterium]